MTHSFEKDYWELHWQQADGGPASGNGAQANPHLVRETADLTPGSALDAGCGAGADALWLAGHGWQVTGADISATALRQATERAADAAITDRVTWVEADLTTWEPGGLFDLVATSYAHPAIPQLDFYRRIAGWVAPGGTLLIVGHLHGGAADGHGHGHGDFHEHGRGQSEEPPVEATVTAAGITALLDPLVWHIHTAEEQSRTPPGRGGPPLHDVIVRASRLE